MSRRAIRRIALRAWSLPVLATLGCSGQPPTESSGGPLPSSTPTPAGTNTLVEREAAPADAQCPHGGTRITFGVDANENGKLEGPERRATSVECAPSEGYVARAREMGPTKSCPSGTILVETGPDRDASGALEDGEVASRKEMCAARALQRVVPLDGPETCTGVRVETGADVNGNGALDDHEVTGVQDECGAVATSTVTLDSPAAVENAAGLVGVLGDLVIGPNAGPVELSKLRYVSGHVRADRYAGESLSFPVLEEVGRLDVYGAERLTTLSAPKLHQVHEAMSLSDLPTLTKLDALTSLYQAGGIYLENLPALEGLRFASPTIDGALKITNVRNAAVSVWSAKGITLSGKVGTPTLDVGASEWLGLDGAELDPGAELRVKGFTLRNVSSFRTKGLARLRIDVAVVDRLFVANSPDLVSLEVYDTQGAPSAGRDVDVVLCDALKSIRFPSLPAADVFLSVLPSLEEVRFGPDRIRRVELVSAGSAATSLNVSLPKVDDLALAFTGAKAVRVDELRTVQSVTVSGAAPGAVGGSSDGETLERLSFPVLERADALLVRTSPELRAITMPKTARLRELAITSSPKFSTCAATTLRSQPGVETATVTETNDAEPCPAVP